MFGWTVQCWSWLQVVVVNVGFIQERQGQYRHSRNEFILQTAACKGKYILGLGATGKEAFFV